MPSLSTDADVVVLHDLHFAPLITEQLVQGKVNELGQLLQTTQGDNQPLFISILSGAFIFTADLVRAFGKPCEIAFVKLASYDGTRSTGEIQTLLKLDKSLAGRHVVVVEDIVDTGRTLHYFLDQVAMQNPASLTTVAFLRKPEALEYPVKIDLVGFDINDQFVVGYGLDYNGLGRNLKGLYVQIAD
jgi:hypoxanthine phosphoribosyltransferase